MFVEFHARSAFSFLEGASQPEELVEVAALLDQSAIGVLDRNGVYGSVRQYLAAKKLGLKAHIGAEVSCTDGSSYPLLCESQISRLPPSGPAISSLLPLVVSPSSTSSH